MDYLEIVNPSLMRHAPELLGWLAGMVFAVRMVRRGGGKAEKLFLSGCSLVFLIQLAFPFLTGLVWWLIHERGISRALASGLAVSLPAGVLGTAGLVCLVYAFWLRFWIRKQESA